jgi:hypothetical protein
LLDDVDVGFDVDEEDLNHSFEAVRLVFDINRRFENPAMKVIFVSIMLSFGCCYYCLLIIACRWLVAGCWLLLARVRILNTRASSCV